MDKNEYFKVMQFPAQWLHYGLMPDHLLAKLVELYEPGNERASEHDRNGVFHWWLKQDPSKDVLVKLAALSFLDPDQIMAADVRSHILKSKNVDEEVRALLT
ncbi:hypothetical protein WBN46_08295 [Pseudoxanthomonas sp. CCNWLW251]